MREISLHLLDIAENSVAAQACNITIQVLEDYAADRLEAVVEDNGIGMDAGLLARIVDPFVTSRTTRKVGLGIPLLKAAAEACEGGLEITSKPGEGTRLAVHFRHSHIDRAPLGDLAGTFLTLMVAYPQIHWVLDYRVQRPNTAENRFYFDDRAVKEILVDVPLTEPTVLAYLRPTLQDGVALAQHPQPETI